MKPIVLEGNLGERHRSLNSATHHAIHNNVPFHQIKEQEEVSDIDRLYKIDCANKYRDLDYILQTLKCEDTLYATRALKCTWLFTDKQYEHIVNPQYLYDTLFPDMMTLIVKKFLAKILKHVRDYGRCEQFYKYYKETKSDRADKLLPSCSPEFIHKEIGNRVFFVSAGTLQSFCRKSPEAIQAYFTRFDNTDDTWGKIYSVRHLYFSNRNLFLDLLEKYFNIKLWQLWSGSDLGYRISKDILKNHKKRVLNNFTIYSKVLNHTILYKSLTEEEVKQIIPLIAPGDLGDFWNASRELKKYIDLLKPEDRFSTFKSLFQRKFPSTELEMSLQFYSHEWYKYMSKEQQHVWALKHVQLNSEFCNLEVYSWYRFCKFEVAFAEVKKIIKTEKKSEDRISMLKTVVDTLGDSTEHAHTLLSYFKERQMNEMPHMKERFLRKVLEWEHIYEIEEKTWLVLQELFISLGLSELKPQIKSGLLDNFKDFSFAYIIIHNKPLPDKLKSQFLQNFSYLGEVRVMVNKDCENKLFDALYQLLEEKINEIKQLEEVGCWMEMKNIIDQFITLFNVWEKSLTDYPHIVSHIRRATLDWGKNYYINEFRELFSKEELLTLERNEKTCLFFLKKDVAILKRYMPKLNEFFNSDNFAHKTLLKKIRIYFSYDIGKDWTLFLINKLQKSPSEEQRSLATKISALCLLLPAQQFNDAIMKYIPEEMKVDMLNVDMHFFSIQKCFAKFLYLTRPPVLQVVLSFSKGDYLQYACHSLLSTCVQMSLNKFTAFIETLLNNPVSIQKHAIRLASQRLSIVQLKTLLERLWDSNKNISIKGVVFDSCFKILCQQSSPDVIQDWWHLVRKFIREMEGDEYRCMYTFIEEVRSTPKIVRPDLCMESWYCMKRAPDNNSTLNYRSRILYDMKDIVEDLNEDFLYEIIVELLEDAFSNNISTSNRLYKDDIWKIIVVKYLLYCNNLNKQSERVEKVLMKVLGRTKTLWDTDKITFIEKDSWLCNGTREDIYVVREMFTEFINCLIECAIKQVYRRNNIYVSPMPLFEVIMSTMADLLTMKNSLYYVLKFAVLYLDCVKNWSENSSSKELDNVIKDDDKYEMAAHISTSQRFGVKIAAMQTSLVQTHSPLVQEFFRKFLTDFFKNCMSGYYNDKEFKISLMEGLTVAPSEVHNVLTAIEVLPASDLDDEFEDIIMKIRSLNYIEAEFMFNVKYGENKRKKFL